ncbi:hypothetical protein BDZ90DRAFT_182412 [Jaminaea rosea]|uniref:Uncharacterized protein n=1 Tax=Jaminaea rosea TaxID=1569628 RepID=A0A316UNU7_9BASI|nr:hypothetical protein BDZ90DRAFT_182412 [Jaminaea rosea]PWN26956.1 hypothetical protein BDZ90DRAFT_182412 [Jaminaea rosea]
MPCVASQTNIRLIERDRRLNVPCLCALAEFCCHLDVSGPPIHPAVILESPCTGGRRRGLSPDLSGPHAERASKQTPALACAVCVACVARAGEQWPRGTSALRSLAGLRALRQALSHFPGSVARREGFTHSQRSSGCSPCDCEDRRTMMGLRNAAQRAVW